MIVDVTAFAGCCGTSIIFNFPYPLPQEYDNVDWWVINRHMTREQALLTITSEQAEFTKQMELLNNDLNRAEKNLSRMGIIVGTLNEIQHPVIWPILEARGWQISEGSKNYNSGKYIYLVYKLLHTKDIEKAGSK